VSRRRLELAATVAVAAGTLIVLLGSGGGALSPPPLGSPAGWSSWLAGREPVAAAFALLRLATLAGAAYVVVVTSLGVVLRAVRAGALVAVADRLTVPPVRRLLAGTVTAGLMGLGPVAAAGAQPAPSTTAATATAVSTSTSTTSPSTTTTPGATSGDTVVLRRLPADPTPPAVVPAATPPERPGATWAVKPGDCFWTIAEDVLHQAWGRVPTDTEVVPYWQALIEANRVKLADKANADLVFPGQLFDIPRPPPPHVPAAAPAAGLARTG
jgi:hypothetical protein